MPQMGESIAEGTVSVWLKKVGDRIEREEPVMEIATDKVDAEIPSPVAGVLVEIVVHEGSTVEVGTIVAYIETDASAVAAPSVTGNGAGPSSATRGVAESSSAGEAGRAADHSRFGGPGASSSGAQSSDATSAGLEPLLAGSGETAAPVSSPAPSSPSPDGTESAEDRLRRRSTPLVRRIAAEHGIDLSEIQGTGRAGRVTKDDVLRFVESAKAEAARPTREVGGGIDWDEYYSEVHHPEVAPAPGDRVEPMSRMTSLIAEHMVLSKRIAPHVHSYFEIDYSRIDVVRNTNKKLWADQGVKVTYTAFIVRAVARALREQPNINASVSRGNVIFRSEVNIGIAVALDQGLIVPVLHRADELSLVGTARGIADLAERARTKRLTADDVKGGTFTITNPGVFGMVLGFPIINQPQVAILAVGSVEKRAVVITDEFGYDAIVARRRGFISLGFDHRLVNGADADRFTGRVKQLLETAWEE
jgi:2-oxoglutarate dehydrogenase E2 component (dihydrolipoamide succinyltransferase)